MPHLAGLHRDLAAEGLTVLAVHSPAKTPEEREAISSETASFGLPFPVLLGDEATEEAYGITAIPTRLLLGREGRILSRETGFSDRAAPEIERRVREALR